MSWLSSPHGQSAKGLLNFQHFPAKELLRLSADNLRIPRRNGTYCDFHAVSNQLAFSCHSAVKDLPRFRVPEEGNKNARTLDKSGRISSPLPPRKELYEQNTT